MAYDDKRLKMFKWLDGIAQQKARYSKGMTNGMMNNIFTIYGNLYATNGVLLAEVEYPEFAHISDDGWRKVVSFTNEQGWHTEFPELAEPDHEFRERIFADQFIGNRVEQPMVEYKFDPAVMEDALKPFKIYRIAPIMTTDGYRCELSGHDDDVSIRVLFMGLR